MAVQSTLFGVVGCRFADTVDELQVDRKCRRLAVGVSQVHRVKDAHQVTAETESLVLMIEGRPLILVGEQPA